jgi:chromosome segregation ATPase
MAEETKEVEEMTAEGEGEKTDQERRIGELEAALAQLQQQTAERELEVRSEVTALKQRLSGAAAKYRDLLLATAPEVPEELVQGETPEEVEASFAAAREVVVKVRRQLEAQAEAERVPTGAPARTPPDLGALSPQEKIAYALSRHS